MNQKELLKNKIQSYSFKDEELNSLFISSFFKDLPHDLQNEILLLDDNEIIEYVKFLLEFKKNHGAFLGYEKKLFEISNLLILKITSPNALIVEDILAKTNLIDNADIVLIVSSLLTTTKLNNVKKFQELVINPLNRNKKVLKPIATLMSLNIESDSVLKALELLENNTLIENPNILGFLTIFFSLSDIKMEVIIDIIKNLDNIKSTNILSIINSINNINSPDILRELAKSFKNPKLAMDSNLSLYLEIINRSLKNPNLKLFVKLLKNDLLLSRKDATLILTKYVLNVSEDGYVKSQNTELKNKILFFVLTRKSMLNSKYLIKVLEYISTCNVNCYYNVQRLIQNKPFMKDEIFNILFDGLTNTVNQDIKDMIIALSCNQNRLKSISEVKAIIAFMMEIKEKYKLNAFYKLFINIDSKSELVLEDINSNNSNLIKMAILKANSVFQVEAITKIANSINNSKYKNIILTEITTSSEKVTKGILELVRNKKILNDVKFVDIFEIVTSNISDDARSLIIKFTSYPEFLNLNNYLYILNIITLNNRISVGIINDFFQKVKDDTNLKNLLDIDNQSGQTFLIILKCLLSIKSNLQGSYIIKLLEYPEILENKKHLILIIEEIINTKEKIKLDGIINLNIRESNNLDKETYLRNNVLSNQIKACKYSFQIDTLLAISDIIKNKKGEAEILTSIPYYNETKCMYLKEILNIPEVIDLDIFMNIIYLFNEENNPIHMYGILELAKIKEYRNDIYFYKMIKETVNIKQVEAIIRILKSNLDIESFRLLELLNTILLTKDKLEINAITEIILASKVLGYNETNLAIDSLLKYKHNIMDRISFSKRNVIKNILETVRREVELKSLEHDKIIKPKDIN